MAIDVKLDAVGDIALESGAMKITKTKQEVARQQCLIAINCNKGEWVFNVNFGVPYLKNDYNPVQLLGVGGQSLIDGYVRYSLMETEYITRIRSYTSQFDPREGEYSIKFEAVTESGEVVNLNLPAGI